MCSWPVPWDRRQIRFISASPCSSRGGSWCVRRRGNDPPSSDEAPVVGERLASPGRLKAAPDHRERVDRFRKKQHLVRIAEGDGPVSNRDFVAYDDHERVEMMATLDRHWHLHVDRPSEPSFDTQHIVVACVDPDPPSRCDSPRPVEAVIAPFRIPISSGLLPQSIDSKSRRRAVRFLSFATPAA